MRQLLNRIALVLTFFPTSVLVSCGGDIGTSGARGASRRCGGRA